jgi:hypothetical protein
MKIKPVKNGIDWHVDYSLDLWSRKNKHKIAVCILPMSHTPKMKIRRCFENNTRLREVIKMKFLPYRQKKTVFQLLFMFLTYYSNTCPTSCFKIDKSSSANGIFLLGLFRKSASYGWIPFEWTLFRYKDSCSWFLYSSVSEN